MISITTSLTPRCPGVCPPEDRLPTTDNAQRRKLHSHRVCRKLASGLEEFDNVVVRFHEVLHCSMSKRNRSKLRGGAVSETTNIPFHFG